MALQQFRNRKRYVLSLIIFLYVVTLVTLLIWIKQLKPSEPAEISQVTFNKVERTLSISGENLPSNFTALLTPNIQREQDTLSSHYTWGKAINIAGSEDHIWVANGVNGILSYNFRDQKNPELAGVLSFEDNFRAWNITIDNDQALIAGGTSGLSSIDISNPATPKVKFTIYPNEIILDSIIKDGTALIASAQNGLIILNIKDKNGPKEVKRIKLKGVLKKITQEGNRAYVVGLNEHKGILHILDISQPLQTKTIATIELPYPIINCEEINNKLFLTMGKHGLYIADINNTGQTIYSHKIEDISAFGLCASGHDIFITNGSHHIHHYRMDNEVLTHIKTFATAAKCHNIMYFNNSLVASLGINGFSIFSPSTKSATTPATIKFKIFGSSPSIVHKNGQFAIYSNNILNLFKTTSSGSILQYDSITFTSRISAFTMDKRSAYVALQNNEIHIINLQRTAKHRTQKTITWDKEVQNLVVDESNLYLGIHKLGVFILNLDETHGDQEILPIIPIVHSRYTIDQGLLFLATKPNGLKIFQLRNNKKPLLISQLQYPTTIEDSSHARDIIINNGYAFIANGNRGLLSIDISNPKQPTIGDALNISGNCSRVALQGNYAYITTDRIKVTVVDISDPLKMKILCTLPRTKAIALSGNWTYQLNEIGVYINSLPKPLKIKKQSTNMIEFELPSEATEGYYDLQLATTQQITKHSDLLHYSQQQNWTMTRELPTQ